MPEPCKSCGAPMIWARTRKGNLIPLDAEPTPEGNIILKDGIAHVMKKGQSDLFDQDRRYLSHFVTCPQSRGWRKA